MSARSSRASSPAPVSPADVTAPPTPSQYWRIVNTVFGAKGAGAGVGDVVSADERKAVNPLTRLKLLLVRWM